MRTPALSPAVSGIALRLGHPLHAALTDIPVGAWTAALIFDGLGLTSGREAFASAADASVAVGLAGALAAAITGMTDWQDADAPARRLGMIHGGMNLAGTALYAASLIFRRRKSRAAGRILGALGYGVMTAAARLGGQMVYEHRVGVDRTAGQVLPTDFVAVLADSDLAEGQPRRVVHDGVPILLVRRKARIFAMAGTCSHFGAPLAEGKIVGDSIQCPWRVAGLGRRLLLAAGSPTRAVVFRSETAMLADTYLCPRFREQTLFASGRPARRCLSPRRPCSLLNGSGMPEKRTWKVVGRFAASCMVVSPSRSPGGFLRGDPYHEANHAA